MPESIRAFTKLVFKKVYVLASTLFCGLPALFFSFFKSQLPIEWQKYTMTIVLSMIIVLLIIILSASFQAFHELRMKRRNELYEFVPEAKKEHVHKIIYDLFEEGKFLRDSCTERRQRWDEEVIVELKKHFTNNFVNNYLLSTGRMYAPPRYLPLDDKRYDIALSNIKGLLDKDFNTYFRG